MELAFGIEWQGGKPVVLVFDDASRLMHRPCSELATQGLPVRMGARAQLTTDLRKWQRASFNEFACSLGMAAGLPERHTTWQFFHEGRRYVVPALVLMRALFRPTGALLPWLYRPQSLEEICTFSGESPGIHVAPARALGESIRRIRSSVLYPLSWLFCFPTARSAWSSVFRDGTQGQLGLDLPHAQVTFVLTGLAHARNVYVTALHIHDVTALEDPYEFAATHPRTIPFLAGAAIDRSEFSKPKQLVALRNGSAGVSDEEWREIEPLLDVGPGGRRLRSNQRATLDGVLQKLCHATPWQATSYPSGVTHSAAATALHRWRAGGRWEKVEEVLRRSRGNQ